MSGSLVSQDLDAWSFQDLDRLVFRISRGSSERIGLFSFADTKM